MRSELSEQQKADFAWFVDNRENLYNKYGNCVLVISNNTIVDVFDDYVTAAKDAMKKREEGSFIVQWLSDSDSCYKAWAGGGQADTEDIQKLG